MDIVALLNAGVKCNASDLHLSPGSYPLLRVDGDLTKIDNSQTLTANVIKELVYSLINKEQQHALETYFELDFAIKIPDLGGVRVNAFHQLNGIAAVFRFIPNTIPSLNNIIESPVVFEKILQLSSGLILVTGPTGCGKSTTLAAMIDSINSSQASHIITIEDPIEYIHQNKKSLINQRQVHRDTVTFATALRSALREDPD